MAIRYSRVSEDHHEQTHRDPIYCPSHLKHDQLLRTFGN